MIIVQEISEMRLDLEKINAYAGNIAALSSSAKVPRVFLAAKNAHWIKILISRDFPRARASLFFLAPRFPTRKRAELRILVRPFSSSYHYKIRFARQ